MTTLANFPMISERTSMTCDGLPSESSGLDCVPACLCAGALYLHGKTSMECPTYTPDSFKDRVYGEGYVGGQAAISYVGDLAKLGVRLYSIQGTNAQLMSTVHQHVRLLHPVIMTERNPYGNPDFSHVCIFFSEDSAGATVLDPWIAAPIYRTDADWENTLIDGEIWIMEKACPC